MVENFSDEELSKLTSEELKNYYLYQFVPHRVRIEASTICQLKCAGCGFQNGEGDDSWKEYITRRYATFDVNVFEVGLMEVIM
ncbi:hypothetical protein [uncultured Methanobrevibacter sp.]|uniref:hypothetical protein n=1 Tax=uncultured Methanobrevibacter sp. TaxID=253161 RepID=UPI0025D0175A|nr:hypothetical protein [uncultured Methanobrevibacter sp.]